MLMNDETNLLLEAIADGLDIPRSYYKKAAERYISFGKWLHRPESRVARFDPEVYLQGSFRYGTVNRPLLREEEYDLDLVSELKLAKSEITQEALKRLLGEEVRSYADAHGIKAPPDEGNRCWTLDYADEVCFHMDIPPCVPEDERVIRAIIARGVAPHLAVTSVGITDRRVREYRQITPNWPTSNPRGLGDWFAERARTGLAAARIARLVEGVAYKSIDEVPSYDWKTPLQRAIQLLKRHRDVMYRDEPDFAPISMIITVLAAKAYSGEPTLWGALRAIVERMPGYVGDSKPRIPNPVNPGEDFADRWAGDPRYEREFRRWMAQVRTDVEQLPESLSRRDFAVKASASFRVDLTAEQRERIEGLLDSNRPANVSSLLSPAVAPPSVSFPDRPVIPRKPGGFA